MFSCSSMPSLQAEVSILSKVVCEAEDNKVGGTWRFKVLRLPLVKVSNELLRNGRPLEGPGLESPTATGVEEGSSAFGRIGEVT